MPEFLRIQGQYPCTLKKLKRDPGGFLSLTQIDRASIGPQRHDSIGRIPYITMSFAVDKVRRPAASDQEPSHQPALDDFYQQQIRHSHTHKEEEVQAGQRSKAEVLGQRSEW